jgi:hypothetical protein
VVGVRIFRTLVTNFPEFWENYQGVFKVVILSKKKVMISCVDFGMILCGFWNDLVWILE